MPFYRCMPPAGSGGGGVDIKTTEIAYATGGGQTKAYFYNTLGEVPVKMTANCNNFAMMFSNFYNFNCPIPLDISEMTTIYAAQAFSNCYNFNAEIKFPENAGLMQIQQMLWYCRNYNQPIHFPKNIDTSLSGLAYQVVNATRMLSDCNNFNSPVHFPWNITSLNANGAAMFTAFFFNCRNYNQKTVIRDCGPYLSGFFVNCDNFNSPILFDERYYNTADMYRTFAEFLRNCYNFNAPILFPKALNITNHTMGVAYDNALANCANFSQPYLYFPIPRQMNYAFYNSKVMTSNINIILDVMDPNFIPSTQFGSMFNSSIATPWPGIKRIYKNNADTWLMSNSSFGTAVAGRYSMFGNNVNVTFTPVTNGYYNEAYNVYFLNNVSDALVEYDNWVNSLNLNYDL